MMNLSTKTAKSRRQSNKQSSCWGERIQKTLEDTPRNLSVIVRVRLRVFLSSDNNTVSPFMLAKLNSLLSPSVTLSKQHCIAMKFNEWTDRKQTTLYCNEI